jgi:thymidylate synthase (FAD)
MNITLLQWTETLKPSYMAAKNCYGADIDALAHRSEGYMQEWLQTNIVDTGHWGILEHLSFTFHLSGISRACSHQLVRHRIASYAQQSQRYIDTSNEPLKYVTPQSISSDDTLKLYYDSLMDNIKECYNALVKAGVPAEDARMVFPNATETDIIMTVNGRQLIEISRKRLCLRAQWEIRLLFKLIKIATTEVCPMIGAMMGSPCVFGECQEKDGCNA